MPALSGVFFVHGLFCPHESSSVLGPLPGNAYDAQFEPLNTDVKTFIKKARRWRRP
jgi:hypothetical protein